MLDGAQPRCVIISTVTPAGSWPLLAYRLLMPGMMDERFRAHAAVSAMKPLPRLAGFEYAAGARRADRLPLPSPARHFSDAMLPLSPIAAIKARSHASISPERRR